MRKRDITELLGILAQRIKERRKLLGITQEQLAELAGVSTNFLAMIEIGQKTPSLETLASLADALGVEVGYLLSTEAEAGEDELAGYIAHLAEGVGEQDSEFALKVCRLILEYLKDKQKA